MNKVTARAADFSTTDWSANEIALLGAQARHSLAPEIDESSPQVHPNLFRVCPYCVTGMVG